ncbi:MAG: hypothetical protein U0V75_11710 [Ferruginibacter sp.]
MAEAEKNNNQQVISYFRLRQLIGILGISLPLLMILFNYISFKSWQIEFSISDYYNNGSAGYVFVGVLFVLGFFLLAYKGYEKIDDRAADVGCAAALGVALFPTTSSNYTVHVMHFVFALLLFSTFIFFSLYLFRKTSGVKKITRQKVYRNRVYVTCGIIMIVCIVGIALASLGLMGAAASRYKIVFWLEAIALGSFGFSWIVKGELLWKDAANGKP